MADVGIYTDFTVLNPEYHSGQIEFLARNLNLFNSASRNAIRLGSNTLEGLYERKSFFNHSVDDLVQRRNPLLDSAVDDANFEQEDHYAIKLNRRIGPIAHTLDSWRKIGKTPQLMSYIFGQKAGEAKLADSVDTILTALDAGIQGVSTSSGVYDLVYDAKNVGTTDTGLMCASFLAEGMSKLGDNYSKIACWVMHSKPFFDLIKGQITDNIFGISNLVIMGGTPATLGRPVIVMDSASLKEDAASGVSAYETSYKTFGLVSDAASVLETETETIVSEVVTGKENLIGRIQGEYAVNIGMKGISYKYGTGGANPTIAAIGTTTNWERVANSVKDCPGIVIESR